MTAKLLIFPYTFIMAFHLAFTCIMHFITRCASAKRYRCTYPWLCIDYIILITCCLTWTSLIAPKIKCDNLVIKYIDGDSRIMSVTSKHTHMQCKKYHVRRYMDGVFCPKIPPTNPPNIYFLTAWQHWLGIVKSKSVFRSTLNLCINLLWNFKNFSFNRFFYWLTIWLLDYLTI